MKKNKIGGNQNRRKNINDNQVDRFQHDLIYKTFIMPKLHYLRIIHKKYL